MSNPGFTTAPGGDKTITYSCGHTDTMKADTTLGEIIQAIGGLCPTCTFQRSEFPELDAPKKRERKTATPRRKSP